MGKARGVISTAKASKEPPFAKRRTCDRVPTHLEARYGTSAADVIRQLEDLNDAPLRRHADRVSAPTRQRCERRAEGWAQRATLEGRASCPRELYPKKP